MTGAQHRPDTVHPGFPRSTNREGTMVQIDIPAAFAASLLFLDVGRKSFRRDAPRPGDPLPGADAGEHSAAYYRFLFRTVFFAGFVIAPAGIYLLAGWPGWEQLYWTERVEQPAYSVVNASLYALFVMAIVFCSWLGHVVGHRWIVTGRERYLRPAWIGLLVAVSLLVLANYPAFTLVGTYGEYRSDRSSMGSVWENPHGFGVGWAIVMAWFAASLAFLVFRIRNESRRES